MRRLVFLLVVLSIFVSMLGCGGSNQLAQTTATPAATQPTSPANSTPTPTPTPTPAPVPTIQFTANPASITAGQSSVLSWSTTDATSVSIQPGNLNLATSGSVTVTPASTTTYTATATGAGGTTTVTATVTVTAAPPLPTPAPTIQFSANPASITAGQSSVLSWSTTDATSVSIQPGNLSLASLAASGSVTVTPASTTTYTATATGAGGTTTATATVTVTAAPPLPTPAPTIQFSANPASITAGQSSVLSWSTTDATSVSIQPGNLNLATSGSVTVTPASTTTYTATATGAGGTTTATATVTVAAATPPPSFSFRFLAWGDSRDYPSTLAALSNEAAALKPTFTVYTGDAESNGFTVSGADAFISALNGYASNGTSAKSLLIRGNHDAGDTAGWQSYYDFSATASVVGAKNFTTLDTDLTYSFDYQNAHFVAVDVPGETDLITTAQMSWIDSDLTAAETRGLTHAFLYWHGPIYCVESQHCQFSGQLGSYAPQALIDVINKHPIVSAMFFGHEHVLAYVHVDGTRISGLTRPFEEVVVGTAGAPLYGCDMPFRSNWCNAVAGYASVDVSGSAVTINYYQQGSSTPINTVNYSK